MTARKTRCIAIATMVGQNYGNRLQNFALASFLEGRYGCRVETLRVPYGRKRDLVKRAIHPLFPRKRWAMFAAFDGRGLRYSRLCTDSPGLDSSKYDLFVMGSDQIWNPDFDLTTPDAFLPQVRPEKKIAYAASFGVSELSPEDAEWIAPLVAAVPRVSVREESGADIVESLTGVRPHVTIDPTLLISADEWARAARPLPGFDPSVPYCFKYVLGEDVNGPAIEAMASDRGLAVVDVSRGRTPAGPAEFAWLIERASLVCTDSFHATVFAALFHRPFAVFGRVSGHRDMSSRISTLCGRFGLEANRFGGDGWEPPEGDWGLFEDRLAALRADSAAWLDDALGAS